MARTLVSPDVVKRLVIDHDDDWNSKRPISRKLAAMYESRYWAEAQKDTSIQIELSRGYEIVESYIASLYAHNPSVVIQGDVEPRGDADLAALAANAYIRSTRDVLEDAARMAIIFTTAFVKLYPETSNNPLRMVCAEPLPPWEVIIDKRARKWTSQRFIGHAYWISLTDAIDRYGSQDYNPTRPDDFLEGVNLSPTTTDGDVESEHIRVVEMYFPKEDRYAVWSPHYKKGEEWLFDGARVEIPPAPGSPEGTEPGSVTVKVIPIRSADDAPIVPIIPVIMSRLPYRRMTGLSALERNYDQIRELIHIRTIQAGAVRKAARQWLVLEGYLDADGLAKLAEGVDGEYVEVKDLKDRKIGDVIAPVPHTPTPSELESYAQTVQGDLDRGSILAPFTRGESTGATATEITALAAYTASEVGRMARVRDAIVEDIARIYLCMLRMYLESPRIVTLDGRTKAVSAEDLSAEFSVWAQDGGSTPVDRAAKRAEFTASIDTLIGLGVPKMSILREFVRLFGLPADFTTDAEEATEAAPEKPGGALPPASQPGVPSIPGATGLEPGGQPSPDRVGQFLPDEEES